MKSVRIFSRKSNVILREERIRAGWSVLWAISQSVPDGC
jgi:hypothetical protein